MSELPRAAPDFALLDQDGEKRSLQGFLSRGPVVLVFYPGDFTPVCTKQLCSYRDLGEDFRELGVQIVGISSDTPVKHKKFRDTYHLTFPLLSDEDKSVAKLFGATSKWLFGGVTRANFIISEKGMIVSEHVDGVPVTHQKSLELRDVLKDLKTQGVL